MSTALEELTSISLILAATNHRHKNQHRLAKWWKAFSVFRRNLSKLVSELEILSANEERFGENKKTVASREVVEGRAEFMIVWLVPKCYLAFSAVVADNQYANLGLMLMGTLARVWKVVQKLRREVADDEHDAELDINGALIEHDGHDLGEVVRREDAEMTKTIAEVKTVVMQDSEVGVEMKKQKKKMRSIEVEKPGKDATVESISKPQRKKKKKTHDEFDDLFGSLL